MSNTTYDFIAVGLGPFNLSLACLTDNIKDLNGLVLEQKDKFDWHPGMMLEGVHLQTPFMSDLVTLADPSHPLSFLNYIKKQGRLYSFYIRESFFLMRSEYNQYCQWACEQVSNIRFNHHVSEIQFDQEKQLYRVIYETTQNEQASRQEVFCKKLILGTGPAPHVPEFCRDLGDTVIHSSNYLNQKTELQKQQSITIIGGGQSAAEIYYDLLQEIEVHGYQLNWVTRSPRFFPLEYSKLTLEMTSPEYVDYFYDLPSAQKDQLISQQKNLYKGINASLINDIYDLLYIKRLDNDFETNIFSNSALTDVNKSDNGNLNLSFFQQEQQQGYSLSTQAMVLATGYSSKIPDFLLPISERLKWDNKGRFDVNRNYSIDKNGNEIFVQNAELHSHGFVTPDLGMACYRNSCIIRDLLGYEYYPIEKRIAFQQFSAPTDQTKGKVNAISKQAYTPITEPAI